jgi:Prophage CP4-57 regulatory protein (AlpA)
MPIEVDAIRSAQSSPMRFLRLPEVELRVGLKRSAIYQRMSEGRFQIAGSSLHCLARGRNRSLDVAANSELIWHQGQAHANQI